MSDLENMQRLRAIRRLARGFPARDAAERLKRIEGIASGSLPHTAVRRSRITVQDVRKRLDLAEKRVEEDAKKRSQRAGRDRRRRGGQDRSEAIVTTEDVGA